MLQAVSLSTNLPVVSSGYYLWSTSKWKTSRLTLETSVRLTVTVYSPLRELTVCSWIIQIGRKLVEILRFEFRHDRGETSFSSLLLVRSRPDVASLFRFLRFPVGLTVRVDFTRDRRGVPPLLVGGPRGPLKVLAYSFRRIVSPSSFYFI